jgi:hypothetical protein
MLVASILPKAKLAKVYILPRATIVPPTRAVASLKVLPGKTSADAMIMLVELLTLVKGLGSALHAEKDGLWGELRSARGRDGYQGRKRNAGGEELIFWICLYAKQGCSKRYK